MHYVQRIRIYRLPNPFALSTPTNWRQIQSAFNAFAKPTQQSCSRLGIEMEIIKMERMALLERQLARTVE